MAEVNRIDLNLGQKNANPFKTTRKSDTNPFRYSNFEGNTLQFADVFEGFDSKNISFKGSKMKLITTSVLGTFTKIRNSITEPIVKFVNRVKDSIVGAWDYAKNTEIKIGVLDKFTDGIHNTTEKINDILSYDIGKGITDSLSGIGKEITGFSHDLSETWNSLVNKINLKTTGHEEMYSNMSVDALRDSWIKENELTVAKEVPLNVAKEVSINPTHNMEVKVA